MLYKKIGGVSPDLPHLSWLMITGLNSVFWQRDKEP